MEGGQTKDQEVEIEILTYVYDILRRWVSLCLLSGYFCIFVAFLRSIEKDQAEISPKQSQECSQKVSQLVPSHNFL